jgi:general secretion pathway protein H
MTIASRMRRPVRGMTLIEVLIVLALIGVVTSAVVIGSGQLSSARLRRTSTMITGAVRVGFSRASSTSKTVRLVLDIDESKLWLEQGDQPHLVQSKDTSGTGGAAAATESEKQALDESSRILKGPTAPRTGFQEIDVMGLAAATPGKGHKPFERGIKVRSVHTAHDDEPRKTGRAYLYFWPGGQTERAAIQLKVEGTDDDDHTVTLLVAPLTGKITVKSGPVELKVPSSDSEASEREETGGF